jgi:hypothetical protein
MLSNLLSAMKVQGARAISMWPWLAMPEDLHEVEAKRSRSEAIEAKAVRIGAVPQLETRFEQSFGQRADEFLNLPVAAARRRPLAINSPVFAAHE